MIGRKAQADGRRYRAVAVGFGLVVMVGCGGHLGVDRIAAPADGVSLFHLRAPVRIASGGRYGHLESPILLRTSVLPGRVVLKALDGDEALTLTTTAFDNDSAQDGTPDFLRLDTQGDRAAFRRWFTYLAEAQFASKALPREINDCAALIRYCYREALSVHNDAWIDVTHLPEVPSIPAVEKYNYPYTPLGASLFRIRPGAYLAADAGNGNFAQFADAETLVRFNAHFISRDVGQAEAGDILMYRQATDDSTPQMPFHTMIYLGTSQLESGQGPYVVYHTGPKGEIRRPLLEESQHHPDPRWRPLAQNSNFLGVYRWNIL